MNFNILRKQSFRLILICALTINTLSQNENIHKRRVNTAISTKRYKIFLQVRPSPDSTNKLNNRYFVNEDSYKRSYSKHNPTFKKFPKTQEESFSSELSLPLFNRTHQTTQEYNITTSQTVPDYPHTPRSLPYIFTPNPSTNSPFKPSNSTLPQIALTDTPQEPIKPESPYSITFQIHELSYQTLFSNLFLLNQIQIINCEISRHFNQQQTSTEGLWALLKAYNLNKDKRNTVFCKRFKLPIENTVLNYNLEHSNKNKTKRKVRNILKEKQSVIYKYENLLYKINIDYIVYNKSKFNSKLNKEQTTVEKFVNNLFIENNKLEIKQIKSEYIKGNNLDFWSFKRHLKTLKEKEINYLVQNNSSLSNIELFINEYYIQTTNEITFYNKTKNNYNKNKESKKNNSEEKHRNGTLQKNKGNNKILLYSIILPCGMAVVLGVLLLLLLFCGMKKEENYQKEVIMKQIKNGK